MIEHRRQIGAGRRLAALALVCATLAVGPPARAGARVPAEAAPAPTPLEVGKRVERTATEKTTLSFAISLSAGDYMSVVGEDHGIATEWVLRDPSGATVLTSWEVLPYQTERTNLEYVAETDGVYVVSYALAPPTDPPALTFVLAASRPATAVDRERAALFRLTSDGIRDIE